ncbi:MAG: hypothetical protein KGY75_10000, partial [Candidatus Cloacimonetes bacterium]|nr:hypothetical protein [Candidatus Cloacimonadota bacterium]
AGTPYFNGWIDFNNDGDWQDAGEQIFLDFPLPAGIHSLNFNVPAGAATGSTFARFRYSTFASLGTTGYAADGEVEDYKIEIIETPDDDCKMHYHQWPDTTWTGIDVRATEPVILADDFLCTESGLINSIHIWGSWKEDMLSEMPTFTLSIWSDNPNGPGGYSQPDELLWTKDYDFTAYTYSIYHTVDEGEYWWDPYTGDWLSPGDWTVWQYDFAIPDSEAFEQVEDSTYWLSVQVFDPMELDFGWKTSVNHWNDDAVWGTDGLDWIELTYPDQHPYYPESIDFAFYVDCTPTPPVVNISTTNDTVCVSWTAVPCANTYTVYSSTDPYATFPSGWTVEQSGITTTTWCEDVSSTNKKFYRITSVK